MGALNSHTGYIVTERFGAGHVRSDEVARDHVVVRRAEPHANATQEVPRDQIPLRRVVGPIAIGANQVPGGTAPPSHDAMAGASLKGGRPGDIRTDEVPLDHVTVAGN